MNEQHAFGCFYKYVVFTDTTHGSHFADKTINRACFNKLLYLQILTHTCNSMQLVSELWRICCCKFRVDEAPDSNNINNNSV